MFSILPTLLLIYHHGTITSTNTWDGSADATKAAHSAALCDGDPIDTSSPGPCTSGDTRTYCYDVVMQGDTSSSTESNAQQGALLPANN